VIKRKTQSIDYWVRDYQVSEDDHEYIYDLLAESGEPKTTSELALAIIRRAMQQEERFLRDELAKALIYDPANSYQVGDVIYFPVLDFNKGEVTGIRPGNNPEHGEFDVITVQMEGEKKPRAFAANLKTPHTLNRSADDNVLDDSELLTPEEMLAETGDSLLPRIEAHLEANPDYFVRAGDAWLTTDQIVPVSIGHLNIAEALIEMEGAPLSTTKLLEQVELDPDLSDAIRTFSLDTALQHDDRFIQVGVGDESAWYLRRLMPRAVLETPDILRYEPVSYDRSLLNIELLQTEYELRDEWSDTPQDEEAETPQSAVYNLIYPHLVAGTMPLTHEIRRMLPASKGRATGITLVDGRWGSKFPAWVVSEDRYVAGLGDWYKEHKLPVGAHVNLQPTGAPNEFLIDFKPQRARRHWMRLAIVQGNKLVFQMQQKTMNVDVDDNLVLTVGDAAAIQDLREHLELEGYDVDDLVALLMPELVRMSPQGTAHVSTLYSAVNLVRRLPPAPIFAALVQMPGAVDTGSGFWSL
jgi:hypothetical protein